MTVVSGDVCVLLKPARPPFGIFAYESHELDSSPPRIKSRDWPRYESIQARHNHVFTLDPGDVVVVLAASKDHSRAEVLSRLGIGWVMKQYLMKKDSGGCVTAM